MLRGIFYGLILMRAMSAQIPDQVLYRSGAILVTRQKEQHDQAANYLYFDNGDKVMFGINFVKPDGAMNQGVLVPDFSRFPTTYYHPGSPVGQVLKRFDWLPGPKNTYYSDNRMPASMIGLGAGWPALPGMLVGTWSEPPVAVISLGAGTLASYARPGQHFDFFERSKSIISLSEPADGKAPFFTYILDAKERGARITIHEGEPRSTLAKIGGQGFYSVIVVEAYDEGVAKMHTNLLTKEAMQLYLDKLAPDGIVCVHCSSRYYLLQDMVVDVAHSLDLQAAYGTDRRPRSDDSLFQETSSAWVIVSRKIETLRRIDEAKANDGTQEWLFPRPTRRHIWTDASHSYNGIYGSDPYVAWIRQKVTSWIPISMYRSVYVPIGVPFDALNRWIVALRNAE